MTGEGVPPRLLGRLAWQGFVRSGLRAWLSVLIGTLGALVLLVGTLIYPVAQAQADRLTSHQPLKTSIRAGEGHAGLLLEFRTDRYRGSSVGLVTVAAVGGTALRPPGVPHLPNPGELVVSPAMEKLLRQDPVLQARYPGRVVALVSAEGLVGPSSLKVYRGAPVAELAARDIPLTLGFDSPLGGHALLIPSEVRAGVPFTLIAFLVPLLALFSVVTTMGSALRNRRVAALRLLGLTSRQVRVTFVGEAVITTAAAFLIALALVTTLRRALAPLVPVSGGVWPQDVTLPLFPVVVAGLVLPALAGLTTWFALTRSSSHPLEFAREAPGNSVRSRRLLLLVLGALLMLAAEPARLLWGVNASLFTLAAGCLVTIAGLISGTSVLNLIVARRLVAVTGRLDSLIAGRRVMAHPTQTAKIATGVSLLVFVSGLLLSFFPLLSEATADGSRALTGLVGPDVFIASPKDEAATRALRATPGVDSVAEFHQVVSTSGTTVTTYVGCAGAAKLLRITDSDCLKGLPPRVLEVLQGGQVVASGGPVVTMEAVPNRIWRSSEYPQVMMVTPAKGADPELVRSAVINAAGNPDVVSTAESLAEKELNTKTFRDITFTALLLSCLVAAASLAAALVDQIQLQRRSYAMLKVTGVSQRTLVSALLRLTMLSVTPTAVIAWGLGMVAAVLFLRLNDASELAIPAAASAWVLLAAVLVPLAACLVVTPTLRTSLTTRLD